MFGRMVRFSRDKAAFITLVIAAAPSLWPRFGLLCLLLVMISFNKEIFTYSSKIDTVFSEASSYRPCFDGVSDFSILHCNELFEGRYLKKIL